MSATFKAARLAAGLNQTQAGAIIGATKRAVQEWEGGRRNIPAAKLALFTMLCPEPTQPVETHQPPSAPQSTVG